MSKKIIYFYVFLQSVSCFAYNQIDNHISVQLKTLKQDLADRRHLSFLIFLIEKFDKPYLSLDDRQKVFLDLKKEAEFFLKREELLKELYVESHKDSKKLTEIEKIIQEDSLALSEILEKISNFQKKLQ